MLGIRLLFDIFYFCNALAKQTDLTRGIRKYAFVDPGGKKMIFFFAESGLSEFRAVTAQKRTFWFPV